MLKVGDTVKIIKSVVSRDEFTQHVGKISKITKFDSEWGCRLKGIDYNWFPEELRKVKSDGSILRRNRMAKAKDFDGKFVLVDGDGTEMTTNKVFDTKEEAKEWVGSEEYDPVLCKLIPLVELRPEGVLEVPLEKTKKRGRSGKK